MTTDVLGESIATLAPREPVTGVEALLVIDTLPDGGRRRAESA
jgi:hypothetical protein